jgi:hypothetical protein
VSGTDEEQAASVSRRAGELGLLDATRLDLDATAGAVDVIEAEYVEWVVDEAAQ